MALSEATLIAQACAGSEEAFAALVELHAAPLYRFLYRRTGNAADADDLVQRSFVRAYRALHRVDPRRPFAPWLFTIARNLAASEYRARRPVLEAEREFDERTPLHMLEEREAGRLLWDWARRTLPENQFTALWLRVEEDLALAAIAERMQKSVSSVKVLLHRARKRLAAVYENSGDPVTVFGSAAEVLP